MAGATKVIDDLLIDPTGGRQATQQLAPSIALVTIERDIDHGTGFITATLTGEHLCVPEGELPVLWVRTRHRPEHFGRCIALTRRPEGRGTREFGVGGCERRQPAEFREWIGVVVDSNVDDMVAAGRC